MSGVMKAVKKVFKGVGKVIKKVIKPVAIAALAVYTGGLALGAMGLASGAGAAAGGGGFFGSLFGAGAQGNNFFRALLGAGQSAVKGFSGGSGIFSKVAGALFGNAGVAGVGGQVMGPGGAISEGSFVGAATNAAAKQGLVPQLAQTIAGPQKAGLFGGASFTDKLLMANIGASALSGFTAPSLSKQYTEAKKFRGPYYAYDGQTPTSQLNDRFPQPRSLFGNG